MIDVCEQNYINGERCLKIKDGCLVCCCHENPGEPKLECTTINNSITYTRYPKAPFEKGKNNVYESEACCVKDVLEITRPLCLFI